MSVYECVCVCVCVSVSVCMCECVCVCVFSLLLAVEAVRTRLIPAFCRNVDSLFITFFLVRSDFFKVVSFLINVAADDSLVHRMPFCNFVG